MTEKIRNALDNKNYTCDVFIDLEKTLDTVNHAIPLDKLKYYDVRGITNNWFKLFSNTDSNILILKNVALKNS